MKVTAKELIFTFSVLFIFVFSAYTKIHNLGLKSLDFDEIYSVKTTDSPFLKIALGIRYDPGNPPLYFMILKAWRIIFGDSEAKFRLPSVIFSLFGFWILFWQARKYLSKTATIIVLLLFSCSGLLFFHSRYTRIYSLVILLTLSFIPLFVEYLTKKTSCWKVLILFLVCLAGFYSHYSYVIFYFFAFVTVLIIIKNNRGRLGKLFKLTYVLVLAYSPWIIYFLTNQLKPYVWWKKYNFGQLKQDWVGWSGWLGIFTNNLTTKSLSLTSQQLLSQVLLLIFDFVLIKLFLKKIYLWEKFIILFFLLYFNLLVFTPLHLVLTDPRYSIFILPMFVLSLGILTDSLKKKIFKYAVLLVLIPYFVFVFPAYISPYNEDWRGIANQIPSEDHQGIILCHPCHFGFSLDYYYKGSVQKYCMFENPEGMYLSTWDGKLHNKLYVIVYPWEKNNKILTKLSSQYSSKWKNFGDIDLGVFTKNP